MILTNTNLSDLTLALVKSHLVIDFNDDDILLDMYILNAVEYCNNYIQNNAYGQTYIATQTEIDNVNKDIIKLSIPYKPYSITFIGDDNLTLYKNELDDFNSDGFLEINRNDIPFNITSITAELKLESTNLFNSAVLLLIGDFYKLRENSNYNTYKEVSMSVNRLLNMVN